MREAKPELAIIGDGYTAAVSVIHLLDQGIAASRILVIGPDRLGEGKAYGARHGDFRLNVRDSLMMIIPKDDRDFPTWAERELDDPAALTAAGAFYRRGDFARYLRQRLDTALAGQSLPRIRQQATRLQHLGGDGWQISTSDGRTEQARAVMLATGNPAPRWPVAPDPAIPQERLVAAPWRGDWLGKIEQSGKNATICLVGGGLTAMDAILAIRNSGHQGQINMIIPGGKLPPAQTAWRQAEAIQWPKIGNAADFLAFMRHHLGRKTLSDSDDDPSWQSRFEALRINISAAWQALPDAEKTRLMQRLGPLWSRYRFRAAPQTATAADAMLNSGQLQLHDGFLGKLTWQHNQICITDHKGTSHHADLVVNCTGMGKDKLLHQLLADGLIQGDALGLAPAVTSDGRIIDGSGRPMADFHAIGPLTRGSIGDIVGASSTARMAAQFAIDFAGSDHSSG